MSESLTLRVPGRFYERLARLADKQLAGEPTAADLDAADAVSRPRIQRYGAGSRAHVTLTREQADTVAGWLDADWSAGAKQVRQMLRTFRPTAN